MAAGEAVRVVGEQLNLGEQSKSLGLEGIKEVGHTGFNLNQKGLREELKGSLMCAATMKNPDLTK